MATQTIERTPRRTVTITTCGYGHQGGAPEAHITIDLRQHFRDPHINPALRYMTARDAEVRDTVLGTAGIGAVIEGAVALVHAYLSGPSAADVAVAVGCAGGRHRTATVGGAVAQRLAGDLGTSAVVLVHRDLDKDVIAR